MLAYVFWHRPAATVERARYEAGLIRFQEALAREPPPGFLTAASFAIEPVPWLSGQPGYEDWYVIEGSWALDPLNGFAVAGARQRPHDDVAAQMEEGYGGLYAHAGGESVGSAQSTLHWLTRPRGIQWQPPLAAVREHCRAANVWRRQMVLGVASEFAVETPDDTAIEVPTGWQSFRVKRVRLPRPSPPD
jgi:hypothetical protein